METRDVDAEYVLDLVKNSEKAVETARSYQEEDWNSYFSRVGIEGPEDASNYFGVLRFQMKQKLDNGVTVAEHLWNYGEMNRGSHPFKESGFESYQEIIETLENLENYFQNLGYESDELLETSGKGPEEAAKWASKIENSLTRTATVI